MTYQVLARKWRPKNFEALAGQQHVLQGLQHALDQGRLHHAYLFTGTRGVGKTTIARIIAKCLNCEKGVSSKPCGECHACTQIDEGRFIDLIEIDAASRTKVEDTRDLLDNVQYAPTHGRYKIYLIDEVHMLSTHSFNALLKTLEEPPEHVKFLLATTDPQKLPITVLSRCLQFHLHNIEPGVIAQRLAYILEQENIEFDEAAIAMIARSAEGSLRDALSLLDQAISFGEGSVKTEITAQMLGLVNQEGLMRLAESIVAQDAQVCYAALHSLHEQVLDYHQALGALARLWYQVALQQQLPDVLSDEFDTDKVSHFAEQLRPEVVQVLYQIAISSSKDLTLAPDLKTGFEMAVLRMLAFRPMGSALVQQQAVPVAQAAAASAPLMAKPMPTKPIEPEAPAAPTARLADCADWHAVIAQLPINGVIKQAAMHCTLVGREPKALILRVEKSHAPAMSERVVEKLSQAIQSTFVDAVPVKIQVGEHAEETPVAKHSREQQEAVDSAKKALEKDPHIRFMQAEFNAIIAPGSVKPVED